ANNNGMTAELDVDSRPQPPPPPPAQVGLVTALYRSLLQRAAEPAGLAGWIGGLDRGATRLAIIQGITNSPEYRGRPGDQFYATYLHRAAEPMGRAAWVGALLNGASETTVAIAFLTSAEYTRTHQDATSFVNGVYADVLGRAPDAMGMALWPLVASLPGG